MAYYIYRGTGKCPSCKKEIVRHSVERFIFCPHGCGAFLDVPPYNSKEEISVHPVQIQAEEGDEWLEMTRQEYADFWVKIKFFCAEEEIMSKENFCPKCARGKLSRQGSLTLGAHEVCDFCRSLFDLCPACGQRLIEREPFPGASFIDSYVCVCEAQLIVPVDPTKKIHEAKAPIALSAKLCA